MSSDRLSSSASNDDDDTPDDDDIDDNTPLKASTGSYIMLYITVSTSCLNDT